LTGAGKTTPRSNTRACAVRFFSSSPPQSNKEEDVPSNHSYAFDENGETAAASEKISFPAASSADPDELEYQPVLLNSKEHAVGYLSKILNARVYEAAIETELQHAKNLSAVSV
jgi:hypothetical protein